LLRQLAPLLDLSQPTVAGQTVGDLVDGVSAVNQDVIRPLDSPLARHPGIVILRGSLAPDGAVAKRTVADDGAHRFSGPARVYRSREEGIAAIRAGDVHAGEALVLTGLGLRGAPGMGFTSAFVFALDGAGLSDKVAVITDGQLSGLVNKGISVAEVSPEGAAGGPLGLVRNGDVITVDLDARTIDLAVPEAELALRRAELPALSPPPGCGWLSVYARTVRPLARGATLGG
jgi:dihydroxy-acid dehydratase